MIYHIVCTHGPIMALDMASSSGGPEGDDDDPAVRETSSGRRTLATTARVMLKVLQCRALVREAMASAASVVWIASLSPDVPMVRMGSPWGAGVLKTTIR